MKEHICISKSAEEHPGEWGAAGLSTISETPSTEPRRPRMPLCHPLSRPWRILGVTLFLVSIAHPGATQSPTKAERAPDAVEDLGGHSLPGVHCTSGSH